MSRAAVCDPRRTRRQRIAYYIGSGGFLEMQASKVYGQTLDDKYRIERELGRGGMGTVYLATHLGTERPVAVKIIAPQFMERPEFVERFRREARAAGRLRHPNVVDVTDFGFAETEQGQVAYLVMEYLDGCTLGEILDEENNLPVAWTLDILEQVCSAVQEAHEQGIIHRDLKPDNIWLEPNQRGGYTVKVLDFGIAKLETQSIGGDGQNDIHITAAPTFIGGSNLTVADAGHLTEIHDSISPTRIMQTGTVAGSFVSSESETIVDPSSVDGEAAGKPDPETIGTRLITDERVADPEASRERLKTITGDRSIATKALTRVGAVLGTPLYMSPEQCRGEHLDARSDVYSLGVIAYQMLSGKTPFTGDFTKVMEAHKELPPPPLKVKKVRKKLKRVIVSALAKDPDERPQSAEAFATILRSRSEGIFGLLRRAGMIYTEHISKFLLLSLVFHVPMILFTAVLITLSFLKVNESIGTTTANITMGITGSVMYFLTGFCAYLIIGTITWIVTQSMAVPLRPIKLRPALSEARKKWRTFAGTGILSTVLTLVIGAVTCGIGFFVTTVLWTLVGPVVMMENLRGRQALKRSKDLVKRSLATSVAAVAIMFLIPAVSAGTISFVVNITARALETQAEKIEIVEQGAADPPAETVSPARPVETPRSVDFTINNRTIRVTGDEKDMKGKLRKAILESLLQILLLPLQIVVTSITAIIVALLYLKTRQAGGESLQDLLAKFEETDRPRKKWQERVRQRLIQSGRVSGASKP